MQRSKVKTENLLDLNFFTTLLLLHLLLRSIIQHVSAPPNIAHFIDRLNTLRLILVYRIKTPFADLWSDIQVDICPFPTTQKYRQEEVKCS